MWRKKSDLGSKAGVGQHLTPGREIKGCTWREIRERHSLEAKRRKDFSFSLVTSG